MKSLNLLLLLAICATAFAHSDEEEEGTSEMSPPPAEWKIWLYSIIGAFASVVVSTVGAVVFYFFPGAICRWRVELLSLSAGAMVGTSFFVLLPEIAEEYELGDDKGIQWMIVGGVLLGLAIDHIIQIFGGHGHPHERPVTPPPAARTELSSIATTQSQQQQQDKAAPLVPTVCSCVSPLHISFALRPDLMLAHTRLEEEEAPVSVSCVPPASVSAEVDKGDSRCCGLAGLAAVAWVNLLGDAMHNLVDGAMLGVAYTMSEGLGLLFMLTMIAHEVPQELGDYVVLVHSGLSPLKATVLNIISGLTCVLGAILGCALNTDASEGTSYLMPWSCGLFIYMSLTEIVPQLSEAIPKSHAHQVAHAEEEQVNQSQSHDQEQDQGQGQPTKASRVRMLWVWLALFVGLGMVFGLTYLPHKHAHASHDHAE